jgi:hypothetical protein
LDLHDHQLLKSRILHGMENNPFGCGRIMDDWGTTQRRQSRTCRCKGAGFVVRFLCEGVFVLCRVGHSLANVLGGSEFFAKVNCIACWTAAVGFSNLLAADVSDVTANTQHVSSINATSGIGQQLRAPLVLPVAPLTTNEAAVNSAFEHIKPVATVGLFNLITAIDSETAFSQRASLTQLSGEIYGNTQTIGCNSAISISNGLSLVWSATVCS